MDIIVVYATQNTIIAIALSERYL